MIENASKFPGRVWVNWYKDDPKNEKIIRWSDDEFQRKQPEEEVSEIKVLTTRDRMIDWTLQDLKNGRIRFFFTPQSDGVRLLVEHTKTTYARTVTDRLGLAKREWYSTGKDDLLHALIYFRIALERKRMNEDIHNT